MNIESELLRNIYSQNEYLEKSINEINDKHTTNNQIAYYRSEQSLWFQWANKMLLYFYYFLVIIFLYILFKQKITTSRKYLATIIIIIFPLIINRIEILTYNMLKYIWTFILCIEYPYQQY